MVTQSDLLWSKHILGRKRAQISTISSLCVSILHSFSEEGPKINWSSLNAENFIFCGGELTNKLDSDVGEGYYVKE